MPTREQFEQRLAAGYSIRADLLGRIAPGYDAVLAAIANLSEASLLAAPDGGWSIRDHLHHLASWERKVVAQALRDPIPPALGISAAAWAKGNGDAINEAVAVNGQGLSGAEAVRALQDAHAVTVATIAALPETEFLRPGYPDERDSAMLLSYFVGNTNGHYAEHLPQIEALLAL